MSFDNPAPQAPISEKCAVDEEAGNDGVAVEKEQTICNDESQTTHPTRTITGWGVAWAWLLSFCMGINFLKLGIVSPSNLVPDIPRGNPPVPVMDNTYFLAFCVLMNSFNYIDEVIGHVKKDRSISSVLLVSAVLAAAVAAASGATAPEVLMIFIPVGMNVGFTAVYLTRSPKAPQSKEMV